MQHYGAGVYAKGDSLTLSDSTFARNRADDGGGMFAQGGSLSISSCAFIANSAEYTGVGISTYRIDSLTIRGSMFSANCAGNFGGGGICAKFIDSLTISGSMFSANCAEKVCTFNHMCSCMLCLKAAQHVPGFGLNF